MAIGEPIEVPADAAEAALEASRVVLERSLSRLSAGTSEMLKH
jgi:hypothetical protein